MDAVGPNPVAVFVLSAAARDLLADGVDPRVVEEVLARVDVDVVPRGVVPARDGCVRGPISLDPF